MTMECGAHRHISQVVTPLLTAQAAGSGTLPVLGTPFLAALLEHAALECLQPFLESGQTSVGTRLELSHDEPTPVGMTVTAEAEITGVSENGKLVTFALHAWDTKGPIGSGAHTRAIVNAERFLARCSAKREV